MFRLLRYLGFRRIAATWGGLVLALLMRSLLSAPPEHFAEWPTAAVRAAANTVGGTYQVAFGLWLVAALAPLRWLAPWRHDRLFVMVRTLAALIAGAGGVWLLIKASGAFAATQVELHGEVIAAVLRVTVVPLTAGLTPWLWIEIVERLRTKSFLWRWWFSGLGAHSAWIAPYELRKITQPIPRRLK